MTIVAAVEERKARRHHPDNGVAAPSPPKPQLLTDDSRITSVESPPQTIAQNNLVLGADLTFRIGKRPPERRGHAQQPKQRRRRSHPTDLFGNPVDENRVEPECEHRL